jgi:hypothetical protein
MRQGGPNNGRRPPRGRHHGGDNRGNGGGNGGGGRDNYNNNNRPRSAASLRQQSFDSNCGDLRVRGNAWQVYEKYQALARDATSGGDRVGAENYLQHAEHYFRIIGAINEAAAAEQALRGGEVQTYGQQPEIPSHYYNAGSAPAQNGEPNGNLAHHQQQPPAQPQAEATVQQRHPQPPSFFSQEEIDEHTGGAQPLVAAR